MEEVFRRGQAGRVERAFQPAGRLDAMKDLGVDPGFYANRRRGYDEILPWDHLDYGVTKSI